MPTGTPNARAYSFFDTVLWIACLNMSWIVFTLLGAGVLGFGPATAAAHILVRRRVRGDAVPVIRGFAKEYVANFIRGNAVALPLLVSTLALFLNGRYFSQLNGNFSQMLIFITLVCGAGLAGVVCYIFPMYARYELPVGRYILTSSRFAARHLPGTLILLFITAACTYISALLRGLIPFFSIGAWLYVTGWLCNRFFTANDEAAEKAPVEHPPSAHATWAGDTVTLKVLTFRLGKNATNDGRKQSLLRALPRRFLKGRYRLLRQPGEARTSRAGRDSVPSTVGVISGYPRLEFGIR